MKTSLLFALTVSAFFIASCASKKNYVNQGRYELKVGETAEIYYFTNSCCYYCIPNRDQLMHTELIDEKTVDSGPHDCDGCNFTNALIFKATSKGIDTVEIKIVAASQNCADNPGKGQKYVIEVK